MKPDLAEIEQRLLAVERSKAFFAKALDDERRHRQWMQERAQLLAT